MQGIVEKPDGTAYLERNREVILTLVMITGCLAGWAYWSIAFFLSLAAQRIPVVTLIMEMLLPIHWGIISVAMMLLVFFRPPLLEIRDKQIIWRRSGERKMVFPTEQLGWVYHGDMNTLVYRGEYLSPRERAVDAVRLFSKEGKLLTSISGKVFAASLTDIAEYLTQKTSAVAGAPPTFSNEIVKTKGIGPLFAGLFGGYILFLTVTALVIYYA
jgi:hypothetical protein